MIDRRGQRGRSGVAWLVLLAVLAAALAWWLLAPQTLPPALRERLPAAAAHDPVLYKWKDEHGRWNITDRPPEGRAYEEVRVDPDVNVLPAGAPPELDRD